MRHAGFPCPVPDLDLHQLTVVALRGNIADMNERSGLIPLRMHAALEPIIGLVFIAAPWIFGFSDVNDATVVSIVLGALVLVTGLTTRWRMAAVKMLSLTAHRAMDLVVGVAAIVAPFVFGFSHLGAPTRFLIIVGALEVGATMLTRWDPADDFAERAHRTHRPMAR
jgi:hypothetical protein